MLRSNGSDRVTYFGFLALFLVPPILALLVVLRRSLGREHIVALVALAAIALLYTSPWDNYLVIRGVWTFDRDKIANWFIWRVPLEEYVFYLLQVLLTGLFTIWLLGRLTPRSPSPRGTGQPDRHRAAGANNTYISGSQRYERAPCVWRGMRLPVVEGERGSTSAAPDA
jgi:lycopene cyclase domain-containing protein